MVQDEKFILLGIIRKAHVKQRNIHKHSQKQNIGDCVKTGEDARDLKIDPNLKDVAFVTDDL